MSNIFSGNQMLIGKRLREFRLSKDMKAIELAKICGISQGSLSGLENGKSYPSAETIINLIRHTDINIEWLLTGEERAKNIARLESEPKGGSKFDILNEVEEWLSEEVRRNPERKIWFELHLLDSFQRFVEWRRKRDEEASGEFGGPKRKVA